MDGGEILKKKGILIVANTGDDSLTIVDFRKKLKVETVSLLSFVNLEKELYLDGFYIGPYEMSMSSEENKIYIVNAYNNTVFKMDMDKRKIEDIVVVGSFPTSIKTFEGYIFISNTDSNSVSILDEKNFQLIQNVPVGEKPVDIEIDRDTKKILVANSNSYSIDVIDINSEGEGKIKLDKNPIKIFIEKGYMYVLSYINNGIINQSNISIINLHDRQIVKSINLKGIFNNMIMINKKFIYLTNIDDGFLYKLDIKEDRILTKNFLKGMPNKILWDKDKMLFITNISENILTIFDIDKDKIYMNINTGKEPNGLLLL